VCALLPVDTVLHDLQGNPHRYESSPLGFDQAFDLGLDLAGLVGGPLGEAFKGLLLGSTLDDESLDQRVISHAVVSVGELPARILQAGGAELVGRILSTTIRVDKRTVKEGTPATLVKQHLHDPDARTEAYGGGNLREAIDAVRWVLEVNYGPFITGLWQDLQAPLAELASSLQTVPKPEESKQPTSSPSQSDVKPTEIVSSTG